MAKRRFEMTENKIARFVREGRGTGDGIDYKPWLTVHDLSSLGRSRSSSRSTAARRASSRHRWASVIPASPLTGPRW